MVAVRPNLTSDYLVVLRLIQPARIQDIVRMFPEILDVEMTDDLALELEHIHARLRKSGRLISVRRGTFILDQQGMEITGKLVKERNLDNARMFLMKAQRKSYHKVARWLG